MQVLGFRIKRFKDAFKNKSVTLALMLFFELTSPSLYYI